MDYEFLLNKMIKQQLENRGIKDKKVIEAFKTIKRHEFVREKDKSYAYDDCPLPIGEGQTISQPYMVAYMTQELEVDRNKKVLEIGTGSGYQAAILSYLAKEVYSIERLEKLHERAKKILKKLNIKNVYLFYGDGTKGLKEYAPFDRIIITGAVPKIPFSLEEQINKEDGIIIAPVGNRVIQKIFKIRYKNNVKKVEEKISCIFVPIYGKYGFKLD